MVDTLARRIGYFSAYGGWSTVFKSKYLWISGGLTLLAFPMWQAPGWWLTVLGVCPDLLGFALAAFALTMGIGNERFRSRLGGSTDGKPSPLLQVAGTFTYFIFVQCLALGYAILSQTYFIEVPPWLLKMAPWTRAFTDYRAIGWFVGVWLFVYAMFLTVAAGKAMFVFARWFDNYGAENAEEKGKCNCKCRCPCDQQGEYGAAEASESASSSSGDLSTRAAGEEETPFWKKWFGQ